MAKAIAYFFRWSRLAAFAAPIILLLVASGCGHGSAAFRPAYIVITADTDGWIVPCGCTTNQSGGLLRRGTYLRELRETADVLYADAGGAPAGDSPYQLAKFRAILRGEALLGIAAHNLGRGEIAFGPAALRSAAASTGVPLISANTRSAADGKPLVDAMRIVSLAGRRIALVGVCSPRFATPQVSVDDPRTAVESAIEQHRSQFDSLVVLAYCSEDELSALAAALPEADAIIGGPIGQPVVPHLVGPTLVAAATSKGKFTVRLQVSRSGPWSGVVQELGPSYGDDAEQLANLHSFLSELRTRDFPAADTGLAPPPPASAPADYRIAGSASCLSCHADSAAIWEHSAHAHAWQTLVTKGFEVDPYCQQCHTTGYGQVGGFVNRSAPGSAALVNVGCESCHGPSLAHVHDPHIRTPFIAADQCIRCHDHENSPAFNYAAYWPRIQHGNKPPVVPTTVSQAMQ